MIPGEELVRTNKSDFHDVDNFEIFKSSFENQDNERGNKQFYSLALITTVLAIVVCLAYLLG
ncbi:hypothetical protein [Fastidiosipila sanguinis]|uniref:Uncharacterized protein n=1 Tax=Fastidiosipila sanguinis TaxID=236753 RepID=A0A2S0KLD4_9FIRM|nr:hypothetical protein [Fastidiosipila sanguinis]AVM41799.1 hypothetical protein C5Q98_00495 [Fastidiosipila sanguinis]